MSQLPDLKDKALLLLARREHSRRELAQKLRQRGFSAADITSVLDELEKANLLSDDRFIGMIIRTRRVRGVGPLKICAELQKHAISHAQILTHEDWQEELWHATAGSARIKRFGERIPKGAVERAQQIRFLQQRGFTSAQIQAALDPCQLIEMPDHSNF